MEEESESSVKKVLIIILILLTLFISISTINSSTITAIGYPSAVNNLEYKEYNMTWKNYCPLCGHHDTLVFNPKGTYEGELTCSHCDADYCIVTGKDKSFNVRAVLIKA